MNKEAEYLVARAIFRNRERESKGNIIVRISTVAVAASVAVMIITLAVIFGFKRDIYTRFTASTGDIILASYGGVNPSDTLSIPRSEELRSIVGSYSERCGAKLERMVGVASRMAILQTPQGGEGVILKGVDSHFDYALYQEALLEGELPQFDRSGDRSVIISKYLADEFSLRVGDRITLLLTSSQEEIRQDLYKVGAIYTMGGGEIEKSVIFTDIGNVQRINGWGNERISSYEIHLDKRDKIEELNEMINHYLAFEASDEAIFVSSYTLKELYPSIFEWLDAHDINGAVVITIMLIVAIFNIITVILILVLEKMQLIGVLKALGMRNFSIGKIFIYKAIQITMWALLWGNGASLTFALLQWRYEIIPLDETGYMLSSVPIEVDLWWLLALNAGVILTVLLLVFVPTRMVSSIDPCRSIKFS